MIHVFIEREFEGFPNGEDKAPVGFEPKVDEHGQPVAIELADAFATMIVGKGLARVADAPKAPPAPPAASAPEHAE